jgi:hypothetical protein
MPQAVSAAPGRSHFHCRILRPPAASQRPGALDDELFGGVTPARGAGSRRLARVAALADVDGTIDGKPHAPRSA